MASSARRDLFLQVSANIDSLQTAMKAGRSVLNEFGAAANDTTAEVQKAFQALGGGSVESSAKSIEAAYAKTFASIRANAQAVSSAPTGAAALQVLNVGASQQAAAAAETQASGLRLVADAAARSAAATVGDTTAARVYATAAEAAALGAERHATALRSQATLLQGVEAELRLAGAAEDEVTGAHNRMGASGQILQHVVRSTTDSFAAGLPVTTIFAEQIGRLGEAASFAAQDAQALGGEAGVLGKMAGFLTGPWGIALTVGVSVLGTLASKFFDTSKATEAAKKSEEEYGAFQGDLANFIDTANGKLRDRLKLLAEVAVRENATKITTANTEASDLSKQAFATANKGAITGYQIVERQAPIPIFDPNIAKVIADAKGDVGKLSEGLLALARTQPGTQKLADAVGHIAGQALLAKDSAAKLTGAQADLNNALAGGTVLSTAIIDRRVAEATATTAVEKAQARLNDVKARGADIDKMISGPDKTAALKQYERDLTAATKAAEAAKAAASSLKSNQQTGRQITVAEATQIVEGIGGTVTSGTRSYAQQAALYAKYQAGTGSLAAKPGTSDHETGQAIDIRKSAGISIASITKAFADAGVHLTQKLDEGDHFHVAFGKQGPSQETIDKRAQAAADKASRDAEAYNQLSSKAQEEHLTLLRGQVTDVSQAAAFDAEAVEVERQRLDSAAQAGVTQKRWTQAQADGLKTLNDSNAEMKTQAIDRKRDSELVAQKLDVDRQQLTDSIELATLQETQATTQKEIRKLALDRLTLEQERSRKEAQALIDTGTINNNKVMVDRGKAQLAQIDKTSPLQKKQVEDETADPLQKYGLELKKSTQDMNSSLKGVAVDGLKGIEDGFVGIISGTESVSQAFKSMATSIIADLARIAVEKLIVSAIGGSFLGLSTGGKIEGKATGGLISGPGTGTSDSILALVDGRRPLMVSSGESIVTANATARYWPLIDAMNKGTLPGLATGGLVDGASLAMPQLPSIRAAANDVYQQRRDRVHVTTDVNVKPSPLFLTDIQQNTVRTVGAMSEPIMAGAQSRTIRQLNRPPLPGGYG